ncbi:putative Competence protein ComEC/Rec2 related protein [Nitrospira japonica]|uniref:Putative Competence protein ComEC/Rec2 related protein n=1 Tax=Nitrospira japonica TaxID=1325564 RepID=A0A1W1I9P2_9BACT|nr:DNA internalization-related competence protein ComEC/Rec2 [Nitrospira japonica]SLM49734.1 putative Competence protein ComEC/Rec2 related protein [Nitrospira japonica]
MLPALTAALIAGLALGSVVSYFPLSISCFLILLAIAASLHGRTDPVLGRKLTSLFAALLTGMMYWSVMVEGATHTGLTSGWSDQAREISGRIVAPVQQGPDRSVLMVQPDDTEIGSSMPARIRVTWRGPDRKMFCGDRVRFLAKLRPPHGTLNPGGFDYGAYLEQHGIEAVASVSGTDGVVLVESGRSHGWWGIGNRFDQWRADVRTSAIHSLTQPELGIFLGIVLGDRGYLDDDLRDQFMATGTVHLLSISGSHLGLVALLILVSVRRALLWLPSEWLLRLSRHATPTRLAAAATVPPVVWYAGLAGAELATVRSLVMVLVALLARWLAYDHKVFHALAFAALLIVLHDPQTIYDISFQLSFLSVLAIAWWLGWVESEEPPVEADRTPIRAGLRWGRDAVVMSAVVTIVTFPLVAFYFNQFPWLGVVTNLVAVPVMGFVLVPIGLVSAVGYLLMGGTELPLASILQRVMEVFVDGLRWTAGVPFADWHVAAPFAPSMLLFYGCMAMLIAKNRFPMRRAACWAMAMLILWWVWSPRLAWTGDGFRVMFLDVAQGDSTVLELPDGEVVLIDGGASFERFDMGRAIVGPYLWNRGIRTIDHVIATHPQLDHVGGLAWVLRHFSAGQYWGTGVAREETFYRRLEQALAARGLSERRAHAGEEFPFSDGCQISIENPPKSAPPAWMLHGRKEGQRLNNDSVVARFDCKGHSFLFAADVEQEALSRMHAGYQNPVEVLKVPHHGALSSLNREWIRSLRPRYAVISVGRYNSYGHPAAAVLDSYRAQGIPILRTDRDGGVWITGNTKEAGLVVRTTQAGRIQRVTPNLLWGSEEANWNRLWNQWGQRI